MIIPTVPGRFDGEKLFVDIYSKLLEDRIIFIHGEITSHLASLICAQILHLDYTNQNEPINIYINSPGGCLYSGLAIHDVMKTIKSEIYTTVIGLAASAASLILISGTKGKRFALKHSTIMLHQPLGGVQGQATDMEIHVEEIIEKKQILHDIYLENTNFKKSEMKSVLERDTFFNPKEALEKGIIDQILN